MNEKQEYYLFIKLTKDCNQQYTGGNIMQVYQAFANSHGGKVWFDGNLVHPHMAKFILGTVEVMRDIIILFMKLQ